MKYTRKPLIGREYSYYTAIPLQVGDIVKAPTQYGVSNALVTKINVSEDTIKTYKKSLKTIAIKMNKPLFLYPERFKNKCIGVIL